MKTLPDTIFPVDTLPAQTGGELMGMVYDEKKKCWKRIERIEQGDGLGGSERFIC